MKHFSKLFVSTLLATSILVACGGGGSSSSGDAPIVEAAAEVSGKAIKGIIANGVVSVYGVTNGVKDSTPLVTGRTGADGSYSVTVTGYEGPVVVEITADASSTMICDVVGGCDGVAFGQPITLPMDFELKAVVPDVEDGEDVTTNVTALTSLAASLAEDEGIDAEAAAEANSQVATLFNITGDLTELDVVDITDSDALAMAGSEAQEAAILNAALLSAALDDAGAGETVADVLEEMASDFVANQGQMVQNESSDTSSVTMAEVLASTLEIIAAPAMMEVDLGTMETTTEILLNQAEQADPGTVTQVEPTTPEEEDDTAAAKAMVDGLRIFGMASTYEDSDEGGFVSEFEMATELVTHDDVDTIFDSLEPISEILGTAFEANEMAVDAGLDPLTGFDFVVQDEDTGVALFTVPVTISHDPTLGSTYSIDVTVPDTVTDSVPLDVDIMATALLDGTGDVWNETQSVRTSEFTASFAIEGSMSTSNVSMSMAQGSGLMVDLDDRLEFPDSSAVPRTTAGGYMETETLNVTMAELALNATLSQLTGTMPISFNGMIDFELENATETDSWGETWDCDVADGPSGTDECSGYSENGQFTFTLDSASLMLSGTFTKGTESFNATVSLDVENPRGFVETETWSGYHYTYYMGGQQVGFDWDYMDETEDETEQNWVDVSFGIALEFDLDGVDETTGVMFTADRTGLNSAEGSLDIKVGSDMLDIEVAIENDDVELTVTDQHSNVLMLTETYDASLDEYMVDGYIMIGEEQVATIDEEDGILIIRYADGTVESI